MDELQEVPDGAIVIFGAHGVSRAVRSEAENRSLWVFDATCPLVTKVHMEVSRYAREGLDVVLIDHRGYPESEGTMGSSTLDSAALSIWCRWRRMWPSSPFATRSVWPMSPRPRFPWTIRHISSRPCDAVSRKSRGRARMTSATPPEPSGRGEEARAPVRGAFGGGFPQQLQLQPFAGNRRGRGCCRPFG